MFTPIAFFGKKESYTPTDPDALDYILRVETADSQSLENGVKKAIDDFFICLKDEGIFDDIKTGCILAGARTIEGALETLVGTNSPSTGFTQSAYDRKIGIKGDSSNIINSDRPSNTDPQNDHHVAVYQTEPMSNETQRSLFGAGTTVQFGSVQAIGDTRNTTNQNNWIFRMRSSSSFTTTNTTAPARDYVGFIGVSRSSSANFNIRVNSTNFNTSIASQNPRTTNTVIFGRGTPASPAIQTDARIAFYSIGEATDLTKLETCIETLLDDLDYAI